MILQLSCFYEGTVLSAQYEGYAFLRNFITDLVASRMIEIDEIRAKCAVVGAIQLSKLRVLSMDKIICDQVSSGDAIWFISRKEWSEFSYRTLDQEEKEHYGADNVINWLSRLSRRQLITIVQSYCDPYAFQLFCGPEPLTFDSSPIHEELILTNPLKILAGSTKDEIIIGDEVTKSIDGTTALNMKHGKIDACECIYII